MICLDSSVAAKLVLTETDSEKAKALYVTETRAGEPVVAPSLLLYEITNVLRRRVVESALGASEARRVLGDFLDLDIRISTPASLHPRALELATAYDLPAVYEAHYLALAEALTCDYWTDDRRLLNRLAGRV